MRAVIYTGGTALGAETADGLREMGYEVTVCADERGELPSAPVDLLVLTGGCAEGLPQRDGPVGSGIDAKAVSAYLARQMALRHGLIGRCLPLMAQGRGKRIGFVTYRWASISDNRDTAGFALHMDAAGMGMQAQMVHDRYGREGFTVRCFAAEADPAERLKGLTAARYMALDFCQDDDFSPKHFEEEHLRLRDRYFVQIPW